MYYEDFDNEDNYEDFNSLLSNSDFDKHLYEKPEYDNDDDLYYNQ